MIRTVLRNLLSNAIKFSHPHSRIFLKVSQEEDKVKISIEDQGIGITAENMKKLFKIEAKYSTRGAADEQGTGLGLILSKEYIEKNRGEIQVKSETGKGSSFQFTLPVKPF